MAGRTRLTIHIEPTAWLSGGLGAAIQNRFTESLHAIPDIYFYNTGHALEITANEDPGVLLEAVVRAAQAMNQDFQVNHQQFYHQLGAPWKGRITYNHGGFL